MTTGAMVLGATRDPVLAFLAGQASGVDLKLLGVDMNLAPVLDVNRNPKTYYFFESRALYQNILKSLETKKVNDQVAYEESLKK